MAAIPLNISTASQRQLIQLFQGTQSSATYYSDRRTRMEHIDIKYAMEQSAAAKKKNIKGKLDPVVTPTVLTHIETIVAKLTEIFLTGYPIFSPIAPPSSSEEMAAMQGSFIAQERQFAWKRNMLLFFKDNAKYNIGAIEVAWDSYRFSSVGSDAEGKAKIIPQDVSGNRIKRLDPYNVFYDTSVPAAEVHTEGTHAGYTERMSRVKLKQMLERLPQENIMNKDAALRSARSSFVKYYRPTVNPKVETDDISDWSGFFGNVDDGAETEEAKGSLFYVTTLYTRIIPKEFKINIPANNLVTIFKIVIVNGCEVVYVEALSSSHQYLPILIAEINEDGLGEQTKSYAERIIPIQNLASDLHTARIASLRRAVSDRALYDPSKISPKDVNSPNPSAKIPVRNLTYGTNINSAYYQIPYRDDQAQYLLSEAQQVERYGQQVTGQNSSSQGMFQPGNKTLSEFQTIMSNADNRTITLAIMMDAQVLVPLKTILLFNTLQFQQSELFASIERQEPTEYNPINVRQVNWTWEVADGLLPTDKVANPALLMQGIQTLAQLPQLMDSYNVGDMFAHMMHLQGVRNLKQFAKTPEQIQQEQQQRLRMAVAEAGASEQARQAAQPQNAGGNPNGES